MKESIKVAAIGGGHGLSTMLRGLKNHVDDITAIVTVADDGGGSGVLREELGILPPGDIRSCILALANTEPTMQELLDYRFKEGSLTGQSFGNLFLAAMNGISPSFDAAVRRMGDVLAITGKVLPVTTSDVHLEAEFENGARTLGESKIFRAKKLQNARIKKMRLVPENPPALPESLEAIAAADLIIIGPGSLYTSIIPNFLVDGVGEAVAKSKAVKIYVMNIMTQDGETDDCTGFDHVQAILQHAPGTIDVCVANNEPIVGSVLVPYEEEGVRPIVLEREKIEALGIRVDEYPLVAAYRYIRHNPDRLADAILRSYHLTIGR
ncbi:MAG: YvcK family protein [Oscillospiraceae bacterium]|nr:YvcK family protein [Oscillospiraceae bacterium]